MKHYTIYIMILLLLFVIGCDSTAKATDWHFGDALAARVKQIKTTDKIVYMSSGDQYIIEPSQSDRQLTVAQLQFMNREASTLFMTVNRDTITLRDNDFVDYLPLNPFENRKKLSEKQSVSEISPFLWADGTDRTPTIELPTKCGNAENCEIVGWVVFETPKSITYNELIFDSADIIHMRFPVD